MINVNDSWNENTYIKPSITFLTVLELAMCLYFIAGIVLGILIHESGMIFFHLLLAIGFGAVFFYSVKPVVNA